MLFGRTSLQNLDKVPRAKTNGKIYGIHKLTHGLVAFAAIVVWYLISGDVEFAPVGKQSKISYTNQFEELLKYLYQAQMKPRMQSTLSWLEQHVFAGITSIPGTSPALPTPDVQSTVNPRDFDGLSDEDSDSEEDVRYTAQPQSSVPPVPVYRAPLGSSISGVAVVPPAPLHRTSSGSAVTTPPSLSVTAAAAVCYVPTTSEVADTLPPTSAVPEMTTGGGDMVTYMQAPPNQRGRAMS
ncbi:hypothetical protein BN946_scf185027.g15 [Trametes cinnabarina]|uniref:Uncharacterized protein n=1 Tax=Pycnoporus cinnabarinus TaxID=5643 RepID=A0A060SNM9_PYCCI|nr:hypothetical protein BN946_scf185027.g15 [Trametes cinnabarina]